MTVDVAVERAREALITRQDSHELEFNPETVLTDLLADLKHWAESEGIDYRTADARAEEHYEEERAEETPSPNPPT